MVVAGRGFGQWELQNSNTTADLRGIHSIGNGVAWASGTNGTVLRTEDSGYVWQSCAVPPGAEKLDFRGIQGFDANTAIVMSSGKGDLSRLYKTTDGCHSWKLVFTNPDEDGFFDSVYKTGQGKLYILGDPVKQVFALFFSEDTGDTWCAAGEKGREAQPDEGSFAASNSELTEYGPFLLFGTGGASNAHVFTTITTCSPPPGNPKGPAVYNCTVGFKSNDVPLAAGTPASGVFSLAERPLVAKNGVSTAVVVAVGGAYDHLDESARTASFSTDGGAHWNLSQTLPRGYRSSVAYDADTKTWITVGPNGTDASDDDGKNWRPLRPDPARHEASDADRNWNAISLPFVVGPHGRIGKLNPAALKR